MADLEKLLKEIQRDWSEFEKQQAAEDLNKFERNVKKLISKASATAQLLRVLANNLDDVWKDCRQAHVAGTSASILGGLLSLGGGVATLMTAGAASPLLLFGMAFGAAGAATNITAGRIDASIHSKALQRAEKAWKETKECANTMNETIQKWQERKEIGRLLCMFSLALHTLKMTDPVIKLLRQVISHSYAIATEYLTRAYALGMKMTSAKVTAHAAAGISDDVVGALAKTGAQSADDVVGTGVKAGANASKIAGKVIIGISAVFLVFDTFDLYFTIQKLIEERGSEAAKELRIIAEQLDKECSFE